MERGKLERFFGRPAVWVGMASAVLAFNVIRAVTATIPDPPKVLIELPPFELTNQVGEPFGSKNLEGKIWIANFIFTSCPTLCPRLSSQMQKIRHRVRGMGSAVHLVSFSVDPERDTPEKLLEYSMKYGATPSNWVFLTGELGAVRDAVVDGFKQPMDPGEEDERGIFDITHGSRFVLVDPRGGIRGYYESTKEGIDRLISDAGILAAHEQIKAQDALREQLNAAR